MQFNYSPLVAEKNNYSPKMKNSYIAYNFNNRLSNPANNFMAKNCLYGATNITKHSDYIVTG